MPPRDEQPTDLWALERLLAADFDDSSSEVAALLDALVAPPTAGELAGEAAVVAAFDQVSAGVSSTRTPTSRRARMLTSLVASKLAIAAATAGVAVAGTAAAAYTGALPDGLQNAAHRTIGAPAAGTDHAGPAAAAPSAEPTSSDDATSTGSPTSTPTGPDATGAAAFGLCTAYTHGGLATTSVAYTSLVKAAGGDATKIDGYCATVTQPGSAPSHPTGSPTSHPTGSPTSHPTGSPTSHPTGSPTTHPGH
jgi:hypothetical protein